MPQAPHIFRTGRFRCELDGQRCTVTDNLGDIGEGIINAKLSEWRELLQAIDAAAAAQQLRQQQRRKGLRG